LRDHLRRRRAVREHDLLPDLLAQFGIPKGNKIGQLLGEKDVFKLYVSLFTTLIIKPEVTY
jgi:hypothetical protein